MGADEIVELLRVEEARARGLDGWRRVDDDHVEGLPGPLEKAPAIVDDDPAPTGRKNLRCIGVEEREELRDAWNELDSRALETPGELGAEGRAHPEADDEAGLGPLAAVEGE